MSISPNEPVLGRRFNLLRTLGEGTFGVVYLAEMASSGGFKRRVALKLLHTTWAPESDAGRRLRDEARLLGRLTHRNIVRVDDLVQLNGRWALVMEFVSGADLATLVEAASVRKQMLSPRAVAEMGAAVSSALVAAWNTPGEDGQPLEVVHRDIKPSNIRLSDTGEVKVLDFGVARAALTGREAQTERVRYGSLGYMAPERLLGDIEGPEGDIYALGVVLWESFTLRPYGRVELGIEQHVAQVAAARAALAELLGDHPVVELVVRTFSYMPGDRPTAEEMEAGLRADAASLPGVDLVTLAREALPGLAGLATDAVRGTVLEESSSGARFGQDGTMATLQDVEPLPEAAATPILDDPPARSRAPLLALLGAGGLALLAAFAFVWGFPRSDAEPVASVPTAPLPAQPAAVSPAAAPPAADRPLAPLSAPADAALADAALADAAPTNAAAAVPPAPQPDAKAATPKATARTVGTKPTTAGATAAPALPAPVAAPPAAKVTPVSSTGGPRLRAAKFSLEGAEGIVVQCGDVRGVGTNSALLRDFPAGACAVTVADHLNTSVTVDAPRGVTCTVDGDSLQCR